MNILKPINQTRLYGLDNYFNELTKLHHEGNYPNKLLLSGQKGIGKCTLAFHFINYVLSINEDHKYDVQNYSINIESPDFKILLFNKFISLFFNLYLDLGIGSCHINCSFGTSGPK